MYTQRCVHKDMSLEYRTFTTHLVTELIAIVQFPSWPIAAIMMERMVSDNDGIDSDDDDDDDNDGDSDDDDDGSDDDDEVDSNDVNEEDGCCCITIVAS